MLRTDVSSQIGLQLVRYNKTTKKTSKPEIIKSELRGIATEVVGYLPQGDSLLIISKYSNKTKKKLFGFATYYNLKTKKAKSIKIAETDFDNDFVFRNTSKNDFILYSLEKGIRGESACILDYIVSDYQGHILDTKERVEVKELSYKEIQRIELSENGNIIILARKLASKGGLFKANTYVSSIYIIKDGVSENWTLKPEIHVQLKFDSRQS